MSHSWRDSKLRLSGAYSRPQKISLCTVVKNRLPHLQQTLIKNLTDNLDYPHLEIVILNYNCPNPDTETWVKSTLGPHIRTGKVNYYLYPDTQTYKGAHAKNLAFRLAKGDILCNVDADNFVGKGFASFISAHLDDGSSYLAGPRDGRGLAGRIALRKEHFELVGGYDERIEDWGGDDHEFRSRLDRIPLTFRPVYQSRHLHAIQHSDELRMTYSGHDDKWSSASVNTRILEDNLNRHIVNPNGQHFGVGRVKHNFEQWIEIDPMAAHADMTSEL